LQVTLPTELCSHCLNLKVTDTLSVLHQYHCQRTTRTVTKANQQFLSVALFQRMNANVLDSISVMFQPSRVIPAFQGHSNRDPSPLYLYLSSVFTSSILVYSSIVFLPLLTFLLLLLHQTFHPSLVLPLMRFLNSPLSLLTLIVIWILFLHLS